MAQVIAQVSVTLTDEGKVGVEVAPAGSDKVVLLGLLEIAKQAVLHPPQAKPPPLLAASGPLPQYTR